MAVSLAQDAISLLIDLAERGEIDPWDVKVIDVIDRFLSELAPATERELYEANLSQSGQAFLYASMLLLLKANTLAQVDTTPEVAEFSEEELLDEMAFEPATLPLNLERQLRRRAVAQPPRRRRVTLKELIEQLQIIAVALEEKEPRARIKRPKILRSEAVKTIAALAHEENLSEMAIAIEQFFADHWAEVSHGKDWIDFELVLEFWVAVQERNNKIDPHHSQNHERVGVFWALLLLSAQSKVELSQDEFYQELRVKSLVGFPLDLAEAVLPD